MSMKGLGPVAPPLSPLSVPSQLLNLQTRLFPTGRKRALFTRISGVIAVERYVALLREVEMLN